MQQFLFHDRHRIDPYWIIDRNNQMNPNANFLDELDTLPNPAETEAKITNRLGFGNAVDFFTALVDGTLRIPNLDLDGDRGYAFRPWEVIPPQEEYL